MPPLVFSNRKWNYIVWRVKEAVLQQKHPKDKQEFILTALFSHKISLSHSQHLGYIMYSYCLYCLHSTKQIVLFCLSSEKKKGISLHSVERKYSPSLDFYWTIPTKPFYTITSFSNHYNTVQFSRIKWPLGGISQEVRTLITSSSKQ